MGKSLVVWLRRRKLDNNDIDFDLADRVLNGDTSAFEQLYIKYQTSISKWIYRMVKNEQDVADIRQDVMEKTWKFLSRKRLKRKTAFVGWLCTVTRNATIDWLKKHRRKIKSGDEQVKITQLSVEEDMHLFDSLHHVIMNPARQAETDELMGIVRDCMDELPQRYREAVQLYYLDEFSYDELAQTKGIPVGTAKSWVHRGTQLQPECL